MKNKQKLANFVFTKKIYFFLQKFEKFNYLLSVLPIYWFLTRLCMNLVYIFFEYNKTDIYNLIE